jgi:hypothetical protein
MFSTSHELYIIVVQTTQTTISYYTNNKFHVILDSGRRIIKVAILIVGHKPHQRTIPLYTTKENKISDYFSSTGASRL